MKHFTFNFRWLLMGLLLCLGSSAWADEGVYYTLDGSITDGTNGFGTASEITQNGIDWSVMGNTTMDPWRIGGKSLGEVDREAFSKTAMGSAISKVELEVGAASSITVNSLKLIVASDASFSNVIQEVSQTFKANSTITFTPTSPATEWTTGAYYKFVFNVSVTGNTNRFVQFKKATFYSLSQKQNVSLSFPKDSYEIGLTDAFTAPELTKSPDVTVTYTSSNPDVAEVDANDGSIIVVNAGTTTVTASFGGNDTYNSASASYTLTITDNRAEAGLSFSSETYKATIGAVNEYPTLNNPNNLIVAYTSSNPDVAAVDISSGAITLVAAGTTTITASSDENSDFKAGNASYTLTVKAAAVEGTLWDEDFSSYSASDVPSGGTYNYSTKLSGTKIYTGTMYAEGVEPELLIAKSGGAFAATIPLNDYYGDFTLTYKTNRSELAVSSNYGTVGTATNNGTTYTLTISGVSEGTESLTITFTNNSSNNGRLDDILLVGTTKSSATKADPELSFSALTADATVGAAFTAPTLNTAAGFNGTVVYSSSDESVAQIADQDTGDLMILKEGTTTITATFAGDDVFKAGSASYTLTVTDNRIATTITQDPIVLDIADVATLTQLNPVVKDANDNVVPYAFSEFLSVVSFEIVSDDTPIIASLDGNQGTISLHSVVGTATLKAYYNRFNDNTTYKPSECTFTITVESTLTVAEVRAQGTGSVTTKGVVTSCSGTTAYIQDATAAICVYGEALTVGDEVKVEGKLSTYNGLLEIISPVVTILSSGNTTTPEVMTIADINNTKQGWFVKIENATVSEISSKNVTIAQGGNSIVVRFNDTNDITFAVDDVISLTGNIGCYNTAQIANPTIVVTAVPSITINPATYEMDAKAGGGELPVTCANLAANPQLTVLFFESDGLTAATYDWITASINANGNIYGFIYANTGAERTAYFKVRGVDADNNFVYSNLVTFTQSGPSVSIKADKSPYLNPWEVAASGDGHTFSIEYGGLTDPDFKVAFYESDGTTAATYDHSWVTAIITSEKKLDVNVNSNDGAARSAYLKVYDTVSGLYSGLFTINQAKFEVDYATLPFDFDGGRADIETTDGLTQEGLDSDYASSPYLKFNGAGDYVILKINERPGKLSFIIKGNSFSGGTFKVQTSEDGSSYTDLATYTDAELTATAIDEELNNLGENVRYIKWVYTNKDAGNVALGKIKLAQYSTVPVVTVAKTAINVDSKENHEFVDVTYENALGGNCQFYTDSKATTTTAAPDWVKVSFDTENDVTFTIAPNTGAERTAYVKIFSSDINMNPVYSDLITITQEGSGPAVTGQTYTLAATISSGSHYIITNSKTDGEAKAMGEQNSNNRAAVDITISGNVATVPSTAGVKEVVIYGPYEGGIYTIVEENEGYLYAASSGNNYLRTEDDLDANGQWTIAIDDTDGFATIKAQGSNTRNWLRYNSGSSIFSCYGSGQQDIYLFEKDGDSYSTTEIPVNSACTDGSKYYATFSKDCAIVVPNGMTASEVGIDADNKLVVTEYLAGAIIPANTGVLLKADQAEKYQVILATGGKSVMGTNNRLRPGGVTAEQMNKFDANCLFYRLTMQGGTQLGFWWGAANGEAFNSGANKAYLAIPKASAANLRGFSFDEDATGIESEELSVKSEEGAIYDLQGRKVTNATRGLYIVNGKKVFIK